MGLHDDGIVDTDLTSLINYAWNESFAKIDKNKNTISDRGWNPLNQVLLLDPDLNATRTRNEKSEVYQLQNNIILPKKDMIDHTSTAAFTATTTDTTINEQHEIVTHPKDLHNNLLR